MDAYKLIKVISYTVRLHAERPKKLEKAFRKCDGKTPYGVHPVWCAVTLLHETKLKLPLELRAAYAEALLYHDLWEDTTLAARRAFRTHTQGIEEQASWFLCYPQDRP